MPPLDNKAVRQAIAYGIDRGSVSQKGESGYEPAGNQTGVLLPTFSSWIDKPRGGGQGLQVERQQGHEPPRRRRLHQGKLGIYQDSSGKKLSFSIINIAGYTDWVRPCRSSRTT